MTIYYTQDGTRPATEGVRIDAFPRGTGGPIHLPRSGPFAPPCLSSSFAVADSKPCVGVSVANLMSFCGLFYFYPDAGGLRGEQTAYTHVVAYHADTSEVPDSRGPRAFNLHNVDPRNILVMIAVAQSDGFDGVLLDRMLGWGIPTDNVRVYMGATSIGADIQGGIGVPRSV